MIFGETHEQRDKRMTTPHEWFAWHPVPLRNGRFVWLQRVVRWRELRSAAPYGLPNLTSWRYALRDKRFDHEP